MFDINFYELSVLAIVALLVYGPDKLPSLARSAGFWVGRVKYFIGKVREDFDRELHINELRDTMRQGEMEGMRDLIDKTRQSLVPPSLNINQKISESLTPPPLNNVVSTPAASVSQPVVSANSSSGSVSPPTS